jgi:hypothetical protein
MIAVYAYSTTFFCMLPIASIAVIEGDIYGVFRNGNYSSIVLLFVCSLFLSSSGIRERMSLRVVFWFYYYVFMAAIPALQIYYDAWRYKPNEGLISLSIILVTLSGLFFELGYRLSRANSTIKIVNYRNLNIDKWSILAWGLLVFTIISTLINGFDVSTSVIRRMFGNTYSPLESVLEFTIRPAIFFLMIALIYYLRSKMTLSVSSIGKCLIVTLTLGLLMNPFSGARSLIFFLYFGVFFVAFKNKLINIRYFFLYFLFLGIIGSKLQEEIRRNFTLAATDGDSGSTLDYIFGGSFDGFENTVHTIAYISEYGSTFGHQILGAVLFFIPRELWPGKPTGSGDYLSNVYLSNYFEIYFSNIATPLISEFLINSNIFLAPVLMLVLGKYCASIDFAYKNQIQSVKHLNQQTGRVYLTRQMLFYPVSLGAFFFILRGDLMTGLSFIVGLLISSYLVFFLITSRNSKNR